jgi:hypothetical protein
MNVTSDLSGLLTSLSFLETIVSAILLSFCSEFGNILTATKHDEKDGTSTKNYTIQRTLALCNCTKNDFSKTAPNFMKIHSIKICAVMRLTRKENVSDRHRKLFPFTRCKPIEEYLLPTLISF